MIRRKVSLLLAILMVITTMTVGLMPVTAGSDNGITTDLSAPYMEDSFYFPSVSFPLEISLFDENRQKLYYASSSGNTVQFSFLLSSSTKYFLRVNSSGQIAHENSRMYSFSITN